jgi:hypothetical protein
LGTSNAADSLLLWARPANRIVLHETFVGEGCERIPGGFILITGLDGIRYAVRLQSVGIIQDADECRDETVIQLHGGHLVRVA